MSNANTWVLIGSSQALRTIEEEVRLAANCDTKVLITGESGVGKEVVARLVHEGSRLCHAPLVTLHCAGVPDTLLESELFGHTRGSFTGADQDRSGRLKLSHGGTLFLDEVGEMSLRMQALLLRFLETGEIQRLGAGPVGRVNVRVIAATNCNLLESVRAKKFGSPKVHVGPELAEGAPRGPVTGAFSGFSLGVLVMGQGPVEARGKRAVFSKARWARLCVRGAGSFHRACPFVTSGPRGALLHLPRVQLVKSRCPYDLRCTCVIFQPERWGPNSQTLAPLRVRAHRGDHAL